jgi:phospholipid/cholesterol/gamma-HCH transport system substrate-binding protein
MAGVPIGQVESITLDPENQVAMVSMKIQKDVPIDEDAIASVKTSGLIGDKYIKISPGGGLEPIAEGGVIVDTESTVDFEELISKYIFGKV